MQTVRDIVEYITKETVDYLVKTKKLAVVDPYLVEKIKRKFLEDKKISPYKNKSVIPQVKHKVQKPDMRHSLTLYEIHLMQILCEVHNVHFNNVFSPSRKTELVSARSQIFAFFYTYMSYTYVYIGKIFGRDHSTVIHNINKHDDWLVADKVYTEKFTRFIELVKRELPELLDMTAAKRKMLKEYERLKNERAVNTYRRLIENGESRRQIKNGIKKKNQYT